jgi:hypothetical protein
MVTSATFSPNNLNRLTTVAVKIHSGMAAPNWRKAPSRMMSEKGPKASHS